MRCTDIQLLSPVAWVGAMSGITPAGEVSSFDRMATGIAAKRMFRCPKMAMRWVRFLVRHLHLCSADGAICWTGCGRCSLVRLQSGYPRLQFCHPFRQARNAFPDRYLVEDFQNV